MLYIFIFLIVFTVLIVGAYVAYCNYKEFGDWRGMIGLIRHIDKNALKEQRLQRDAGVMLLNALCDFMRDHARYDLVNRVSMDVVSEQAIAFLKFSNLTSKTVCHILQTNLSYDDWSYMELQFYVERHRFNSKDFEVIRRAIQNLENANFWKGD